MRYMVITWADRDNPFSEMFAYGPFPTEHHAREYASKNFGVYWRLATYFPVENTK